MRPKKSVRSKKARRASAMGSWTLSLAVCVVAAAVLMAARQPSPSTDITTMKTVAAEPTPQKTQVARAQARTVATSAPAPKTESTGPESSPTTITGCLERDDETFRLRDTAGADVPQSRSWKSGFLKRGPAAIEVVDAANRLNLSNHVGRRVSVSGARVDREMQARSLRRVGGSCA